LKSNWQVRSSEIKADPPYGLEKNVNDPAKELDFQGVSKLDVAVQIFFQIGQLF
jgi:hypothetical protein